MGIQILSLLIWPLADILHRSDPLVSALPIIVAWGRYDNKFERTKLGNEAGAQGQFVQRVAETPS